MKREHPNPYSDRNPNHLRSPFPAMASEDQDDELLAVLGYKVRSSEMAEVAQRLEQLDEAITGDIISGDSVHYNPSELSAWLDSMMSEITPPPPESEYDLKAIPGFALCSDSKRIKIEHETVVPEAPAIASAPVVMVDSQENGIRLVHALMACAEAVNSGGLAMAEVLLKQINLLAASQAGAMKKVATHFAQALARRIYSLPPENLSLNAEEEDFFQMHFYEACPYLKFAHFTANQAILEAFHGRPRVHVVDFSIGQGMQWPALMQALALRPEGPPVFRLTGIGPPSLDNSDRLQEVGWKLAQLASTLGIEFEFRGFVANSLADLDAKILNLRSSDSQESLAVNSVFSLHKLLARRGSIEKVLSAVKEMNPEIVAVVEQEANHNGPDFLHRFTESLHYYSTMFDSLEPSSSSSSESTSIVEVYLGKQILNVVASEGPDRVDRHETMVQWRDRFESAGFEPAHLGSNAFKQASMLLALYAGGDGYGVEEKLGCLTLGWHSRPLIATSAWKPSRDRREL